MPFIEEPTSGFVSEIVKTIGYRPIEITLTFSDGSKAVPDSIGKARKGIAFFVGPELLTKADSNITVSGQGQSSVQPNQIFQGAQQTQLSNIVYKTSQKPILVGPNGASVRVFWHDINNSLPSELDIPISTDKIKIDSRLGLIEINDTPPISAVSGSYVPVAYYYSAISETTPKILTEEWESMISETRFGKVGYSVDPGLPQVYPVTRNVTDYVYGKEVNLKKPNLDKSSPDYYPVYEYIVREDGTVTFSVPLNELYGQTAKIEVKYNAIDINPRLVIDIVEDADKQISTSLSEVSIVIE